MMKNIPSLLFGLFILSCSHNHQDIEKQSENQNIPQEKKEEISQEVVIGRKIIADVYESNEHGLKTYLRFEESDGSAGLFGSLTLANSLSSCKYIYTYSIKGKNINTTFFQSDCGAQSSDQLFSYDTENNTLTALIQG
jgi:hypothetical protein